MSCTELAEGISAACVDLGIKYPGYMQGWRIIYELVVINPLVIKPSPRPFNGTEVYANLALRGSECEVVSTPTFTANPKSFALPDAVSTLLIVNISRQVKTEKHSKD